MSQRGRSDSIATLHTWLAGLLGRPLTQDESEQLLALFRAAVLDTVKEMKRLVEQDPGAHR